jgi:hypothetical protein
MTAKPPPLQQAHVTRWWFADLHAQVVEPPNKPGQWLPVWLGLDQAQAEH